MDQVYYKPISKNSPENFTNFILNSFDQVDQVTLQKRIFLINTIYSRIMYSYSCKYIKKC